MEDVIRHDIVTDCVRLPSGSLKMRIERGSCVVVSCVLFLLVFLVFSLCCCVHVIVRVLLAVLMCVVCTAGMQTNFNYLLQRTDINFSCSPPTRTEVVTKTVTFDHEFVSKLPSPEEQLKLGSPLRVFTVRFCCCVYCLPFHSRFDVVGVVCSLCCRTAVLRL